MLYVHTILLLDREHKRCNSNVVLRANKGHSCLNVLLLQKADGEKQ